MEQHWSSVVILVESFHFPRLAGRNTFWIVMNVCLTGRERLEVIAVKKYFPQRVYGIVRLKGRSLSPQARRFIEAFRSAATGH